MRQLAATCAHRVLQIQPRVAAVLLGKKTHPKWSQFAAVDATLFCYFHGYGISLLGARTTELPHSCWSYIQFLVVYHWFIHFFVEPSPFLPAPEDSLCAPCGLGLWSGEGGVMGDEVARRDGNSRLNGLALEVAS